MVVLRGVDTFHKVHLEQKPRLVMATGHVVATGFRSMVALSNVRTVREGDRLELSLVAVLKTVFPSCSLVVGSSWMWKFRQQGLFHVPWHLEHRLQCLRRSQSDRTRFLRRTPQIYPAYFPWRKLSEQFPPPSPGKWRTRGFRILRSAKHPCTLVEKNVLRGPPIQ